MVSKKTVDETVSKAKAGSENTGSEKAAAAKPATAKKAGSAKMTAAAKTAEAKKATAATKKSAAAKKATAATKKTVAAKKTTTKTAVTKKAAEKDASAGTSASKAAASPAKKAATAKAASAAKKAVSTKAAAEEKATSKVEAATARKAVSTKEDAAETAAEAKPTTAKKTTAAAKKKTATAKKAAESAKKTAATAKKATEPKAEPAAKKTGAAAKKADEKKPTIAEPAAQKVAAEPVAKKPAAKTTVVKAAEKDGAPAAGNVDAKVESTVPEKPGASVAAEAPKADEADAKEPEAPVDASAPVAEFADLPPVLIAAAECSPLAKVGGLADVVGALPKYLRKLGVDARVVMPLHRDIKERYGADMQHLCNFESRLGWRSQYVGLEKLELDGNVYYFIDNEFYFGGPVYCGGEFEGEQYAFFTRAVVDAIPQLDFTPGILHSNDWHTAMMPLLVRTQYQGGMQEGLRTLQTIHNLHFQGQFSHEFDRDLLGVDDYLATPQFIEHYGCDNMLKAGIVFANKVNTVSPTYAQEICEPFLGESLDGVLRSRGEYLWGILNGIDTDEWNPETDPNLPTRFTAEDLSGKAQVKAALLDELGLQPAPEGEEVPVIAMVGRLTKQKGIDLVRYALDDIMAENVRMVVLGAGDEDLENFFRDAESRYKGRLCSYIGYAGDLSHRIYAGSDLFLMPSLFEPCGISQMISMRYGTLPIVRETGGLRDTVIPYNEFTGEGNGFSFANFDAGEMLGVIRYALSIWWSPEARKRLIEHAMASDFGFDRCARSYAELYRAL